MKRVIYNGVYTRLCILLLRLWSVSHRPAQNVSLSFMEVLANESHISYRACLSLKVLLLNLVASFRSVEVGS